MFGVDDAIGLGIQAVGLGMQIFGGNKQSQISAEMAKVSKDEAMHEKNINNLKAKQMELEASRTQLQNIRNIQRARAMGIASAVNQGANKGSGLQGGLASISDQGIFNMLGVNQALSTGRGINAENNFISDDKMKMADLKGQSADAQGWASLGGALMKAGGTFGSFGANLFGGGGSNGSIMVGDYSMPTIGYTP